jgi:Xaa-Pro aminopeptidase
MEDGDLLLIDACCEWGYHAADITRTFPVNGRFTPPQRRIYDVVLRAQLAAIDAARPGNRYEAMHEAARRALVEGLVALRLLPRGVDESLAMHHYREFYMHGTGHWLGMDVHDVGDYKIDRASRVLEPGMVLTVEPGLYFDPSARASPSTCASTARRRCGSAACAWAWPPPRSSRTRRRPRRRPSPTRSPRSSVVSASGSRTTSS